MERDELLHRISVGSAYLQRPGLTEEQVATARVKVERYRQQLKEIDGGLAPTNEDKAKAVAEIAKIRELLDGAKLRRRAL